MEQIGPTRWRNAIYIYLMVLAQYLFYEIKKKKHLYLWRLWACSQLPRVLWIIQRLTFLHRYHHCRVQRVLHPLGNYILREMIHFHAFHLLSYKDNKSIICLKNTVKIPAILFHYHNDHCTLFMEGCSVFYRKVHLLGGPPAPVHRVRMGGGRPAHIPCPSPHPAEHFLTGPAPGPQRCLERGALVSTATCGGLNPWIRLQAVGANAITAQPGAAGAYYTHQSPLPQHTAFLVARVKAGAAPGADKC